MCILVFIALAFLLPPTSVTQAEGVIATFHCQHLQADNIVWRVNGTGLNQLNSKEIVPGATSLSDGMGGLINTAVLSITALPSYNGTNVTCIAILLNGTPESSSPANLTVQGDIFNMLFYHHGRVTVRSQCD